MQWTQWDSETSVGLVRHARAMEAIVGVLYSMYMCVCACERERESVCVCVRARAVCECVCVRCVCVCVCVCAPPGATQL